MVYHKGQDPITYVFTPHINNVPYDTKFWREPEFFGEIAPAYQKLADNIFANAHDLKYYNKS